VQTEEVMMFTICQMEPHNLSKLASVNKKMAWTTVNNTVLSDSDISNMIVIRELLYIKHNFANMTLYSKDEIDFILEYCCTR